MNAIWLGTPAIAFESGSLVYLQGFFSSNDSGQERAGKNNPSNHLRPVYDDPSLISSFARRIH